VLIDDISTDNSYERCIETVGDDNRFSIIKNEEKKYALKNIVEGIGFAKPDDDDIVITVDGDDWLYDDEVFQKVNQTYINTGCLITYGNYERYPDGKLGHCSKYSAHIVNTNAFRQDMWRASHLRTFKYKLWKNIKEEDFLDNEGNYLDVTWDLAFMFPMLEMAGEKSQYIDDILYVYNCANPLNDHKIDNAYQMSLEREIRTKQSYSDVKKNSTLLLLNANRFDIAAKIIYLRSLVKGTDKSFGEEIYLEHLRVWNGLNEISPPKNSSDDFLNAFKVISKSIQDSGFDTSISKVPVINESPINGAHRIASCIVHGKDIETYEGTLSEGQYICNYEYFKNKKDIIVGGLDETYLDEMALEFCRTKDNLFTISIFPSHDIPFSKIISSVRERYNPIYSKEIELTEQGKFNYVHNLYYDELWIGNKSAGYPGVKEKSRLCFSKGSIVKTILVEEKDISNLEQLKQEIRSLCGTGNHSAHINDTQEETWRIASCVYNKNSIHHLNNKKIVSTPNFDLYIREYYNILKDRSDSHDFCIDSSAVLSSYGLRDCRDLDFLCLKDIRSISDNIDCHNDEIKNYKEEKNAIIYDPRLHFYAFGIKFASLKVIKDMKTYRNEEKDKVDVQLMMTVLGTERDGA
jgi:glycosyltransferase involved in cell wall biosynthesis